MLRPPGERETVETASLAAVDRWIAGHRRAVIIATVALVVAGLPFLLKLPFRDLPTLVFDGQAVFGSAHWKVDAINEYARDRPAAWLDDNIDETCAAWAERRSAPTLIVETKPSEGLTDEHVTQLLRWADDLEGWIR